MGIGQNIKFLREKYDMTQDQLADKIGVSRESVVRWEADKIAVRDRHIIKMAELFGVDPDDIKSEKYGIASQALGTSSFNPLPVKGVPTGYVPFYGHVHAGEPTDTDTIDEILVEIPQILIDQDPQCYALKAEGDCMNRVYPEGCLVVVSPNSEPVNGSVAVLRINDEVVMRRYYRTAHTLVLSPDSFNTAHTDMVFTGNNDATVEIQGKVIWYQPERIME